MDMISMDIVSIDQLGLEVLHACVCRWLECTDQIAANIPRHVLAERLMCGVHSDRPRVHVCRLSEPASFRLDMLRPSPLPATRVRRHRRQKRIVSQRNDLFRKRGGASLDKVVGREEIRKHGHSPPDHAITCIGSRGGKSGHCSPNLCPCSSATP